MKWLLSSIAIIIFVCSVNYVLVSILYGNNTANWTTNVRIAYVVVCLLEVFIIPTTVERKK